MQVGDLVKQVSWDGVGLIIEEQGDGNSIGISIGAYWRVLFGDQLYYVNENDLEVIK